MASLPILGYWDIRGYAQPIRYLLHYAGVPFVDKRYKFDGEPFGREWFDEKHSLGLDFPNIPYWIEDDFKISQSQAILRYLARKYGLASKDERTLARQEMIEQQISDIKEPFFQLIFDKDWKEKKDDYLSGKLVPQLEVLAKFLGEREWLTDEFSYVDILLYETLDWFRVFSGETIDKFPTLTKFLTRFENLGPIKEYRSSPDFKDWPLFGPILHWGFNK